jgi:hypothetical protein
MKVYTIFFLVLIFFILLYLVYKEKEKKRRRKKENEGFEDPTPTPTPIPTIDPKDPYKEEKRIFPFRYFTDGNGISLPIVAVTGFFRDKEAKMKYYEYQKRGFHIFGITAYKTFPNKQRLDISEGQFEKEDDFDYTGNIKNWLCCFKNKEQYGFTNFNHVMDMSESDFYNAEEYKEVPKKYDFIYICNKDGDDCPMNGWNSINRNFDLALKCFPILMKEFNLKGLVLGREGCGLEALYGNNIEIAGFLPWHILQDKMKESRMLFVPNIYDASPRVVAECITKNVPVLMNQDILCGYKYIQPETGEFFSTEKDFKPALERLLSRLGTISPREWWRQNYSQAQSYKKLRDFLAGCFPGTLDNVELVKFIL